MGRYRLTKARATVGVVFRTRQQMDAIAQGLGPELRHPAGERATAKIVIRGRKLSLRFEANDSAALRAIMSSYLRLLVASLNVSDSLMQLERSHAPGKTDNSTD
ncbi:MAG: KEOPS complex subunit Pcc1 [Candidatus Bathyarchaeia archaeon]